MQSYDGAASGNLAALLEQSAKFGIRAVLLNQNPEQLNPRTLNALTTNRSHLLASTLNSHAAALLTKEWGGEPESSALTRLPRYHFIAQVTHGGGLSRPSPSVVFGSRTCSARRRRSPRAGRVYGPRPPRRYSRIRTPSTGGSQRPCRDSPARAGGVDRRPRMRTPTGSETRRWPMSSHPAGLPMASVEILASLAQHRLLRTDQVREIHRLGSDRRWAQKVLMRLRTAGLVDRVRPPRRGACWFATARGVEVAREAGALTEAVPILGPQAAMNQLQAHTLAVNDAAICFLRAARARDEEFGPFSWRHEVLHPLGGGRGRRRRSLVADAVLTYLREEDRRVALEQRFLELDRATLSIERLAAELARYAELHGARDGAGEPLWKAGYPRFPSVVCVLAGERREVLERRRSTVIALLRADPQMSLTPEMRISICLLEDLRLKGPFAPIFRTVGEPKGDVDWLRRAPQEVRG